MRTLWLALLVAIAGEMMWIGFLKPMPAPSPAPIARDIPAAPEPRTVTVPSTLPPPVMPAVPRVEAPHIEPVKRPRKTAPVQAGPRAPDILSQAVATATTATLLSGEPSAWQAGDQKGTVSAGESMRVGASECRDVASSIAGGAAGTSSVHRWCREGDAGAWRPIS